MLNTVGNKHLTSSFNLRAAIKDELVLAIEYAPEIFKNFLMCDAKELIYISQGAVDILTDATGCAKEAINTHPEISKAIDWHLAYMYKNQLSAVTHPKYPFMDTFIKTIVFDKSKCFLIDPKNYTREMLIIQGVAHELGHWLVDNGFSKDGSVEKLHLGECAAEAYGALRVAQLFGNKINYSYNNNATYILEEDNDLVYYCDAITQKVDRLAKDKNVDLNALTHKETVKLAGDIAIKYSHDKKLLHKVKNAYKSVRKADEYAVQAKKILKIIMKTKDHDVYRAGKRCLERYALKPYVRSKASKLMKKYEIKNKIETDISKARDVELIKKGEKPVDDKYIQNIVVSKAATARVSPIKPTLWK